MLVSILIPVFNGEDTIERAVDSARRQRCEAELEILIVDDASRDSTRSLIDRLAGSESRIRVFSNPENSGVAYSRNVLLDNANGDWVAFLDADDVWKEDKIQICIEAAAKSGAELVTHGLGYLAKNGSIRGRVGDADFLQAALIRRGAIGADRFEPSLRAGEDTAFFSKIKKRVACQRLPDILTGLFIRPGSATDKHWLQKRYVELWHAEHPGAPHSSDEQYRSYFASLPLGRRVRLLRLWLSQKMGRLGAGHLLAGSRVRATWFLALSAICDPRYLLARWNRR